uniref:SCP domain-containing protein n=1 Tax=Mesocestoides corti TaxID=53468 RepID=A0A5K3FWX3_MESCO
MVWSQSTAVGCAIKTFQNNGLLYTTCIYKPGDYTVRDRPYEGGQSCTKCPNGFACYRNQCTNSSSTSPTTSSATITSTLQLVLSLMLILRGFV